MKSIDEDMRLLGIKEVHASDPRFGEKLSTVQPSQSGNPRR